MSEDHTRLELTLTIHGLDEYNRDVDAEVFVKKLATLLKGIRLSDKEVNGRRRHKLLLTELSQNCATASVREQVYQAGPRPHSGLAHYEAAVEAVFARKPSAANLPLPLLREIASLNQGVGRSFDFGVFKSTSGTVIRIDDYLAKAAGQIVAEVETVKFSRPNRFSGIAFGYFEGILKLVDLRGDLWKGALILSAGGKQVECTVGALSDEELGKVLNRRVAVYGKAHYDGSSGLPERIEVSSAKPLPDRATATLSRWRGAFRPLGADPSEGWN